MLNPDCPYAVQRLTPVKPISANAVQRGHNPMSKAKGPRNSAATMMPATMVGYGMPFAARDDAKVEKAMSLLKPDGRNKAATSRRPKNKAQSSLRLNTCFLPVLKARHVDEFGSPSRSHQMTTSRLEDSYVDDQKCNVIF